MTSPTAHPTARAALPILVLTLVWGCNWPILKMGVTELAPLTFRSLTLPFAAIGMLLVARLSGDAIRVPRALWPRLVVLALFNIAGWNGFVLFGVQQLPAGRSAILAYTMPVWATMIAAVLLHEPLSRRKLVGLALGVSGMAVLIGEQIGVVRAAPFGALMILAAAIVWALGTVLLRKWQLPVPQNALSGWMMLLGWLPVALLAPLFDPQPERSRTGHGSRSRARCPSPCLRCRRCRCRSSACFPASYCSASGPGRRNGSPSHWSSRRCSPCCSSPAKGA